MKKTVFLLALFLSVESFANSNLSYLIGMRNTRYASLGIEFKNKWGLIAENSIFTQGVEKQYARIAPYYHWTTPWNLTGYYSFYAGMRYDQDFYDIGARFDIEWTPYRYIQLGGTFNPFYDSYLKNKIGYEGFIQSFIQKEVGIFFGVKNLPFYRDTDRRFMGGLTFVTGNIVVKPELSIPTSKESHLTRVSLFFIYRNLI